MKSPKKAENNIALFSVPADFNKGTLEKLAELNRKYKDARVDEVYGNLPGTPYGSGRASKNISPVSLNRLKQYVAECDKNGLAFNYTFNASTLSNREYTPKGKKEILSFLGKLHRAGIRRFTVAVPSVISLITNNFPRAEVVLSVVDNITTAYQLSEFLDAGKLSRVYVAEEMNRKIHKLERLVKRSPVPVATIVNTFCLFECAYRPHHYNFMTFRDENEPVPFVEYYGSRCRQLKENEPLELLKMPWIRPVDIGRYLAIGIRWFKITGREMIKSGADIPAAVEAYMSKSYDGDLIDLLNNFSRKHHNERYSLSSGALDAYFRQLFAKKQDCSRDLCETCGLCGKYSAHIRVNRKEPGPLPAFKRLS